jgi:predicted RNA-binding protein YlqC (UPF0109 family)
VKQLVEFLAKSLVSHPDDVHITERSGPEGIILELKVSPEDLGRIIGRKGQTVKSIRQVLTVAAIKAKTKVSLLVQE